jgi:hypothetical protein
MCLFERVKLIAEEQLEANFKELILAETELRDNTLSAVKADADTASRECEIRWQAWKRTGEAKVQPGNTIYATTHPSAVSASQPSALSTSWTEGGGDQQNGIDH